MGLRVGVLPLRERVDRAQRLAPATHPLEATLDLVALGLSENALRGADLAPEHRGDPGELRRGLVAALALLGGAHLGGRDPLPHLSQARLKLGLFTRALAEPGGHLVSVAVGEHSPLDGRRALAARVTRRGRRIDQAVELGEGRLGRLQRALERALKAPHEQLLDATGRAGGSLRRLADGPDELRAGSVRGGGLRGLERAARLREGLAEGLQPGLDRLAVVVGSLGQGSKRLPAAFELRGQLRAPGREGLRAGHEAFVRATDLRQPSPGLRPLAIARGEPFLDGGAPAVDVGKLSVERVARGAGFLGRALRPLGSIGVRAQLGRKQAGAKLG